MLKIIKIESFKKRTFAILRWTGEHMFLGFLVLLLIAILFSSAVFYRYVYSLEGIHVVPDTSQSNFENAKFQQIIKIWEAKEIRFEETGTREYRDIFLPNVPDVPEPEELTDQ